MELVEQGRVRLVEMRETNIGRAVELARGHVEHPIDQPYVHAAVDGPDRFTDCRGVGVN